MYTKSITTTKKNNLEQSVTVCSTQKFMGAPMLPTPVRLEHRCGKSCFQYLVQVKSRNSWALARPLPLNWILFSAQPTLLLQLLVLGSEVRFNLHSRADFFSRKDSIVDLYHNFWGRKPWQISRFHSYPRRYSSWNIRHTTPLTFHKSFLCEMLPSYWSAKVSCYTYTV